VKVRSEREEAKLTEKMREERGERTEKERERKSWGVERRSERKPEGGIRVDDVFSLALVGPPLASSSCLDLEELRLQLVPRLAKD
jgi:hypothetical protein